MIALKRLGCVAVLCCFLLCSCPFLGVRASASGDETISINDFDVEFSAFSDDVNDPPLTNDYALSTVNSDWVRFFLPTENNAQTAYYLAYFAADVLTGVRSGAEYHVNYNFGILYPCILQTTCEVQIYNSDGSLFKTKQLFLANYTRTESDALRYPHGKYGTVDFNFRISDADLPTGGYSVRFLISILCNNSESYSSAPIYNNYGIFLSSNITFENLDDNSGMLDGILDWIKSLYYNIAGGGPDELPSLGQKIVSGISVSLTNLKNSVSDKIDSIQAWFTALGDRISGFFIELGNNIRDLFIPADGYFDDLISNTKENLNANLGFISEFPELFSDLIDNIKSIMQNGSSFITLPQASITLAGHTVVLWESQQFDFNSILAIPAVNSFYNLYKAILTLMFGGAIIYLYYRVFDKIFGRAGG